MQESALSFHHVYCRIPTQIIRFELLERDIGPVFSVHSKVSVAHLLTSAEITEVVKNRGDQDTGNKGGVCCHCGDDMMKMCDGFIEGLQWCGFTTELKQFGITKFTSSKTKASDWRRHFKKHPAKCFLMSRRPIPGSLTDSDVSHLPRKDPIASDHSHYTPSRRPNDGIASYLMLFSGDIGILYTTL